MALNNQGVLAFLQSVKAGSTTKTVSTTPKASLKPPNSDDNNLTWSPKDSANYKDFLTREGYGDRTPASMTVDTKKKSQPKRPNALPGAAIPDEMVKAGKAKTGALPALVDLASVLGGLQAGQSQQPAQPEQPKKPLPFKLVNPRPLSETTSTVESKDQSTQQKAAQMYLLLSKQGAEKPGYFEMGSKGWVDPSFVSDVPTAKYPSGSPLSREYINPELIKQITSSDFQNAIRKDAAKNVGYFEMQSKGWVDPSFVTPSEKDKKQADEKSAEESTDALFRKPTDSFRKDHYKNQVANESTDKPVKPKEADKPRKGYMQFGNLDTAEAEAVDRFFGVGTAKKGLTWDQLQELYKTATTPVTEKTDPVRNRTVEIATDDLKNMSGGQREALKYNTGLTTATEHDARNIDYKPTEKELEAYDTLHQKIFGGAVPSGTYMPETLEFLDKIGYTAADKETLDDFRNGRLAVGARQLARYDQIDMNEFQSLSPEDKVVRIREQPLYRMREIIDKGIPDLTTAIGEAQSSLSNFRTNFGLYMNATNNTEIGGTDYTIPELTYDKSNPRTLPDGSPGWGWGSSDQRDAKFQGTDETFQTLFEQLARAGDDEDKVKAWDFITDKNSDPKMVQDFIRYFDERTSSDSLYGLSYKPGRSGNKYKSRNELRQLFNLGEVTDKTLTKEAEAKGGEAPAAKGTLRNPRL